MSISEQSMLVAASIETVFDVIADFANYPKFLPEIEESKIIKKSTNKVRAFFVSNLIKHSHYTLEFNLKRPKLITWKMLDGDVLIRTYNGTWKLEKLDKQLTDVTCTIEMKFSIWVPGSINDMLIKSHMPSMMSKFKIRAEELVKGKKSRGTARRAPTKSF